MVTRSNMFKLVESALDLAKDAGFKFLVEGNDLDMYDTSGDLDVWVGTVATVEE